MLLKALSQRTDRGGGSDGRRGGGRAPGSTGARRRTLLCPLTRRAVLGVHRGNLVKTTSAEQAHKAEPCSPRPDDNTCVSLDCERNGSTAIQCTNTANYADWGKRITHRSFREVRPLLLEFLIKWAKKNADYFTE